MTAHASNPVLDILRDNPGHKFSVAELVTLSGRDPLWVKRLLASRFADGRYGIARERMGDGRKVMFRYWVPEGVEFALSEEERVIANCMVRTARAVTPSHVAERLRLEVARVVEILERWSAVGNAVRCELLLRSGPDRFEYRIATAAGIHYGRIRAS